MKSYLHSLKTLWRTKIRYWWNTYEWPVVLGFGLCIAILGYIGFRRHLPQVGELNTPWDLFYRTLQLFVIDSGSMDSVAPPLSWELNTARFLAPLIAGYTAVQALMVIFAEQLTSIRLRTLHNHIIVCGLGRKGMLLTERFVERGELVVVIEQDETNDKLDWCKERGVIVLHGNATDRETLEEVCVHRAKYIIAVTKDDGVNAEVSVHSRSLLKEHNGDGLTCLIHISDPQLCHLLGDAENKSKVSDLFTLEFFSVFETGSKILLKKYPPLNETESTGTLRPHLLVVGVGQMGGSLVVEAARKWNRRRKSAAGRLRMMLIDKTANEKVESLLIRYPMLKNICEIIPTQMDVNSPEYQRGKFLFNNRGESDVTSIYVCIGEDATSLSAAPTLQKIIKERPVPIVVRMNHNAGFATLLGEDANSSFRNVHAFGLLDRTCTPDLLFGGKLRLLAQTIHEEYVRDQRRMGMTPADNPSIVSWEVLPGHLKESNRRQADHIRVKLKAIRCEMKPLTEFETDLFQFTQGELETLAEMEHQRWIDERTEDGWMYGEEKDIEKKISPHLVPWNMLAEKIKEYDRNAVRNIPHLLDVAGFEIERVKK